MLGMCSLCGAGKEYRIQNIEPRSLRGGLKARPAGFPAGVSDPPHAASLLGRYHTGG